MECCKCKHSEQYYSNNVVQITEGQLRKLHTLNAKIRFTRAVACQEHWKSQQQQQQQQQHTHTK